MKSLLTAAEAASVLKVKPATLYAYVSRGLLQSVREKGTTHRRYRADDVLRLGRQKGYGHQPKKAVGEALHLGLPVLDSHLTLIEDGQLYYRGQSVADLARTASLEAVARLLWGCGSLDPFEPGNSNSTLPHLSRFRPDMRKSPVSHRCIEVLAANPLAEGDSAFEAGAAVVRLVTAAVLQRKGSLDPIDLQCAKAWRLDARARDCVRAGLVVCADHELNVSSFTARCVASCGASLSATVMAGLAALGGSMHGGYSNRVEAMWDAVQAAPSIAKGLRKLTSRVDAVPGFWHPLYPGGDPRCAVLFDIWKPNQAARRIADEVANLTGQLPTIDFGLVALRRGLGLHRGAAADIFTVARAVGWVAHAIEQRLDGRLIRPRSRYVGVRPESLTSPKQKNVRVVKF